MSFDPFIKPKITLLDKTQLNRTIIAVESDATTGNLVRHRKEGSYTFAGVRKNRHGTITLRAKDGLFITKEPIMTRDVDFPKYVIEVQFFQHSKSGDTGHPAPEGRVGELVRYDLSEPVQDSDEKGQLLTVQLTAVEARLRQSFDSESHRLETPKQSFIRRLDHYGVTRGVGSPSITQTPSEIELPDLDALRQDWLPGAPISTHDLLVDDIDKLREPAVVAGDFDDFYYYFVTSATLTNNVAVKAEIFGKRNATDRGEQEIILKPLRTASTDTYEKKHSVVTANKKIRNVYIVRGANGAHAFPMAYARFASDWEHARNSADWQVGINFEVGDFIKFGGDLHKCKVKHTSALGTEPIPDTSDFFDDLSTLNTHTPLTNDIDIWLANLDGKNEPFVPGVSGGILSDGFHRGFSVDMNICNTHYDIGNDPNPFLAVSGKDIEFFLVSNPTSLPAAQIVDGFRGIVSNTPTGDFAGQNNKLAEFDEFKEGGAGWQFSNTPVNDEFVHDRSKGETFQFEAGAWNVTPKWKLFTDHDNSSPWHPCRNVTLVTGPDGRLNSAIRWEYDWNDNVVAGGKTVNRASRWAGFSIKFPIPHRAQGGLAVGDIYKNSMMDFENLSKGPDGNLADWNRGPASENLGNLRGVACKLKLGFIDSSGNDIDGLANMSTVWWFRDKFNRVVFTKAKVRRVGQFAFITFDAGPNANLQLHENRTEELFQLQLNNFAYVFPFNDNLPEKEYSGIRFDWHFVKEMGMFYEGSYDQNFFYTSAQNIAFDVITERLKQAWALTVAFIQGRVGSHIIDTCNVELSELRFLKDAYVLTASGVTADARVERASAPKQFDYLTLRDIGKGKIRRAEHYPQFTPIDCYADVRMRFGERFKASGTRWSDEKSPTPGNIREMVCAEYTIFESDNGSRMQALGYTRFGQF